MKGRRLFFLGVLLPVLAVMISCTSTSLKSQRWAGNIGPTFKKIVVLGWFNSPEDRENFESRIVQAIKKQGGDAVSSLSCLTPGREYTKPELERIFTQNGFDAILLMKISNVEVQRTSIPETFYSPLEPYYASWYPYWTEGLGLVMRGGYHEKHTEVLVENVLFSLRTERLVWVGRSETSRIHTVAKLASSLGPAVAKDLKEKKLFP